MEILIEPILSIEVENKENELIVSGHFSIAEIKGKERKKNYFKKNKREEIEMTEIKLNPPSRAEILSNPSGSGGREPPE